MNWISNPENFLMILFYHKSWLALITSAHFTQLFQIPTHRGYSQTLTIELCLFSSHFFKTSNFWGFSQNNTAFQLLHSPDALITCSVFRCRLLFREISINSEIPLSLVFKSPEVSSENHTWNSFWSCKVCKVSTCWLGDATTGLKTELLIFNGLGK